MQIPERPPNSEVAFRPLLEDPSRLLAALNTVRGPTYKGQYLHWDKLRHLAPPQGLSNLEWWGLIKWHRLSGLKNIPLADTSGRPFKYAIVDEAVREFHGLDKEAAGQLVVPEQVTNPQTRDQYIVHSLMEEAITSSQIEGAATTRQIAKEMLRTGRKPRDKGERMIANNYAAMRRIREIQGKPLTPDLIIELQRILTNDAADVPDAAGRLRRPGEAIAVYSETDGQILHTPPPAEELSDRVQLLCQFANEALQPAAQADTPFVHPVARAIILHFWLAYDHPFADGNGRTARALFYWSMLSSGYWLCEFISISQQIKRAQAQYGRAFLFTETDDNDLTYFLLYHLNVIRKAIDELNDYLKRKMSEVREAEHLLRRSNRLNHRQVALLSHALRHPEAGYTIVSHQRTQAVTHETARTDLFYLQKLGLFESKKYGRSYYFFPVRNLEKKMSRI